MRAKTYIKQSEIIKILAVRNLSRESFADALGVTPAYVAKLLSDRDPAPVSPKLRAKIMMIFDIRLFSDIFTEPDVCTLGRK